jgi:pimeloyl-ACP methyl ester carboxylesterase
LLEGAGHRAIAVDLPGDDEQAGLDVYTERVISAVGRRTDAILVAQSLAGFTAAQVASRVPLRMLVFVNAMIPLPGETAGEWWDHTGAIEARVAAAKRGGYAAEVDVATYFLHDVPEAVVRQGAAHQREEAEVVFTQQCRFDAWPEIPMHVVAGADDRFFPRDFQERIARERLGKPVDVIPGGHLVALANPAGLAEHLLSWEREGSASPKTR